jgi:peptide/nickel transport system permease protein/oligopeptide transport system permease protein
MLRYLAVRFSLMLPILLIVSVLVSMLIYLIPGDPVRAMYARSGASAEQMESIRNELGLNEPWPVQYSRFMTGMVTGEVRSIRTRTPVVEDFFALFPNTLQLAAASLLIAVAIGVPLGVVAANYPRSLIDYFATGMSAIAVSIPNFWLALLLILVFAQQLAWLPATGGGSLQHLILPAVVLAVEQVAIITNVVRSNMLEVLREDYVRTARAKGLGGRIVVWGHGFRNALIPTITLLGLNLGYLLSGAVVIESIFARPGIGRMIVDAILAKDFPVVQGAVLLTAVVYLLVNLGTDILYAATDPRLRTAS